MQTVQQTADECRGDPAEMTTPYYSSEFDFAAYCIASTTAKIARYTTLLETKRLTKRQRAKIEAWRDHERNWLAKNEARRTTMLAENFDVVRRKMMSDYEIIALDPTRPILRDAVTVIQHNWTATQRQGDDLRDHRWRGVSDRQRRTELLAA